MKLKTTLLLITLAFGLFMAASVNTTPASGAGLPTRMPRVVVFNGNGAYHTSVEGFKTNASVWGYEVVTTTYLEDFVLENAEILILNGPDYMTTADDAVVTTWWNLGGKTLWVAGESDYGGYWNPADLNELIVDLLGKVIIVDDAVSDPISQDGASYRPLANTTQSALGVDMTGIENISMHGPTGVAPWDGPNDGNQTTTPGGVIAWTDNADIDWIVNSSKYAMIQDQDGDDDDVWEGPTPLVNQSLAMVAVQDNFANGGKMVFAGESFFADYKDMFGYTARYVNNTALNNIPLTRELLEWSYSPGDIDVALIDDAKTPIVTVFTGNGGYHTSIEGFKKNATTWGYSVNSITDNLTLTSLTLTDVLILNAPDYLTASDVMYVTNWWNTGGKTLWVIGESDYGGYWNPADLNELIVDLLGKVIIVDDAVSDPISQDGASYRPLANTTQSALGVDMTGIENISMHGPTGVAPWDGPNDGNQTTTPGGVIAWTDNADIDWIVNSSKYAMIQDQDGDDDDVWEGPTPLVNQSLAMVAVQDNFANGGKMVFAGESFFADYKDMFGYTARYVNNTALNNIPLTRELLEWSYDPLAAPAKTRPVVYVWSGNGAYHTSVDGFIKNASVWGYDVFASTYWVDIVLEISDVLIVNAPDFLTDFDYDIITHWWNSGNRTIWFIGESDYGGYWNPADINELIVDLGGKVIIVDDAVSDPISQDGASYRPLANTTQSALGVDMTGIENISMHGPTGVAPWDGPNDGNQTTTPGGVIAWTDNADIDWIVNSSKYAMIQDQDGDDDDVWEGPTPLINQSLAMVAVQQNAGVWGNSKMVFAGESFFADYKDMFGYTARYVNNTALNNIPLTEELLDWSTVPLNYYQFTDDMYAPSIEFTGDTTHTVADAPYVYDNEEFTVSFMIHDYPNAYSGLSDLWLEYDDGTTAANASITQVGLNSFSASFGPFPQDTDVSYFVYVKDATGWWTISETFAFSVEYSDTVGPDVTVSVAPTANVWPTTAVTVTAEVVDMAEDEEVVSGIDSVVFEYSTNGGSTWTEFASTNDGSTYTGTLTLGVGTVQVRVTATDNAGNSETSDVASYTVVAEPTTTTTTTTKAPSPGFEMIFGLIALAGLAVVISRRKER